MHHLIRTALLHLHGTKKRGLCLATERTPNANLLYTLAFSALLCCERAV